MDLLFYTFSFFGVVSSFSVISVKNPVYSVFFLITSFCLSSCVLLLLSIDFLSIIFIVVYVGAIAVLFLFVVMMLNIRLSQTNESIVRFLPLVVMLGLVFVSEIFFAISISNEKFSNLLSPIELFLSDESNIRLFSNTIYTHYWFLFIVSGLILLIGMLGTISLTLHHSLNVRRQAVYQQVGRNVDDSISFFKYSN
jgi:NADH-quinone oxidoreductase subunit J